MFNRFITTLLILTGFIASSAHADDAADVPFDCFAEQHHRKNHSTTNLAPTFDLVLASPITDNLGFSLLGEIGPKSYRYGGTIAFLCGQNRFKFSGEQLAQDLRYNFSPGKVHRWVNQYAVGGTYQYIMCSDFFKSLDVNVTYSRAFGRTLRPVTCIPPDQFTTGTLYRQIVGGRNTHIGAGLTLTPWECAELYVGGDWDQTRYKRQLRCDDKISGFGGTVGLFQRLPCDFNFNALAEFRRPFNYYEASIGWGGCFNCSFVDVSVYGSYTQGREGVPNVSTVGLAFDVAFGNPLISNSIFPCCNFNKDPCCAPCYDPCACACLPRICDPELLAWMSLPAVYMPVVLTKTSEVLVVTHITPPPPPPPPPCPTIIFNDPGTIDVLGGSTINISQYFTNPRPLTFTLAQPIPAGVTLTPQGMLTWGITSGTGSQSVNIQVTNGCTTQTFTLKLNVTNPTSPASAG